MDPLSAVFLGCFVFGFAAALASFALGAGHGFHLGGHGLNLGTHAPHPGSHGAHLPAGHAAAGHAAGAHGPHAGATARPGLFPVNPTTVLTFLTWFGGAGFVLRQYYGMVAALSLVLAGMVGLAGAALVFVFLLKVLLPNQTEMLALDYDPVGSVGRVSAPIRAEGVGEVVYTRGGTRRSLGARSLDGRALERGVEVVIAKYERGLAYVQPWEELVSGERRMAPVEGND